MMMSGSWRMSVRMPLAKSTPMPGCTCIWLNAGSTISIGSSTVQTFTSGRRELLQRRVERRRLARAGRPRHEDDAVRMRHHVVPLLLVFLGEAELAVVLDEILRIEDAHDELFAERGRHRREPQLDFVAVRRDRLQPPVLRPAPLHDVHAPEHLDAARHRRHHRRRDLVDLVQHAVDAEAHVADLAPRLEMWMSLARCSKA